MAQRRTRRRRNGVPAWAKIIGVLALWGLLMGVQAAFTITEGSWLIMGILLVVAVMLIIGIVAPLRRR